MQPRSPSKRQKTQPIFLTEDLGYEEENVREPRKRPCKGQDRGKKEENVQTLKTRKFQSDIESAVKFHQYQRLIRTLSSHPAANRAIEKYVAKRITKEVCTMDLKLIIMLLLIMLFNFFIR